MEVRDLKIDKTVARETLYIAAWVVVFSVLMQAVFLIIHAWNYTVITANLLSAAVGVLNFLLMGITVQKSLEKDEKQAKTMIKTSQILRLFMIFAVAVIIAVLPCFDLFAGLIPLFFPRIAIALRPLFNKKMKDDAKGGDANGV